MYFNFDANFFEDDTDFEDEEFENLAVLIVFPRRQKIFRTRINHFASWRDDEFFDRFRLSKSTVRFIVDLIGDHLKSRTDWYVNMLLLFYMFKHS